MRLFKSLSIATALVVFNLAADEVKEVAAQTTTPTNPPSYPPGQPGRDYPSGQPGREYTPPGRDYPPAQPGRDSPALPSPKTPSSEAPQPATPLNEPDPYTPLAPTNDRDGGMQMAP